MIRMIAFFILSIPIILISRNVFFNFRSHGFYRFLAWECILWLLIWNLPFWFYQPFSLHQILSWLLLLVSIYMVVTGTVQIRRKGHASHERTGKELYSFEKTTRLVTHGIYRYIRHPMYSSLLFLTWGIFFKNPGPLQDIIRDFSISILSSLFLYITARLEELENIAYFGDEYVKYRKRSHLFIPYVF
jgi:protein-S-isoprenylcysteine O-methyltransferase Ste14